MGETYFNFHLKQIVSVNSTFPKFDFNNINVFFSPF